MRRFVLIAALSIATSSMAQNASLMPRAGYPLVGGSLTQGFDVPWSANSRQRHTGFDISSPRGTTVFAIKDGAVVRSGWLGRDSEGQDYGYYAVVRNDDGTYTGYLHIRDLSGRASNRVRARTGFAAVFRDHLHLNDCRQEAGCQHGAFPNPTWPSGRNVRDYYRAPSVSYPAAR
jgi:hypothetical protein